MQTLLARSHLDTVLPASRTALCSVVTALRRSPPDTCRGATCEEGGGEQ
jgi:hypothetical protein